MKATIEDTLLNVHYVTQDGLFNNNKNWEIGVADDTWKQFHFSRYVTYLVDHYYATSLYGC